MRLVEKWPATAPRHAARSREATRAIASAIAVSSSQRKPVTPWSTTSGAAPSAKATTGVPHANASIITMPNGSFQRIGNTRGLRAGSR